MSNWIKPRDEYYVQTGSMFENPHGVPHDEIVRFVLENPPEVSAQVVFGKYVESSGLVFTGELVQMAIDRALPRVMSNTYLDKEAAAAARISADDRGYWGHRFHTGVDFARQTDFTVISVIDTLALPAKLVYFKRLNRVPWDSIYAEVGRARQLFGPNILCDSTGPGGDVVMDALESSLYCPHHHRTIKAASPSCVDDQGRVLSHPEGHAFLSLACCEGFTFSGPSKKQLVDHLRLVLSAGYDSRTPDVPFGHLRVPPIVQLEEELSFYAWEDKKLQTDCLFSLALACWSGLEERIADPVSDSPYGE